MTNPFEKPPMPEGKPEVPPTEGEKPDLTTPEARQKEIERIFREEEKPEEEIKEKSPEEILEERRNEYVAVDKEGRETLGKMKKKELKALEKTIEPARELIQAGDSEKLKSENEKEKRETEERKSKFIEQLKKVGLAQKKAEAVYEAELKKAEYDRAKEELGKKMLAEGKNEAEIFQKLVLEEREILNQAKIETWPPKEKGIFKKGLDWWMRRGTATRLLISTGLVTGVVAVAGGFSAPAIALFAGQRYLRGAGAVLVAKLTGKGVDWAMEKNIKAKEETALSELKREFSLEKLKDVDKKYEKILEEIAGKRRKKLIVKAGVMAATGAGAAMGLGWLEGAYAGVPGKVPEVSPEAPPEEVTEAPTEVVPPAEEPVEPVEAPPAAEISGIETAQTQRGDSIWRMSERQLEARYGEKFTGLDEARKTYVIDAIKDKVAAEPEKFGLTDIDKIKIGQKVDFSSVFEDKTEIEGFFDRAGVLSQAQVESIEHNNQILKNWLVEHPGEELTSEKVEEILAKGKVVPPAEAVPPAAEEELAKLMERNEMENVKAIGLTPGEYDAIKDLEIGKLFDEIPESKDEAWKIFGGEVPDKSMDLPHHGIYGAGEFKRHIKLAEFIRSLLPEEAENIKKMTISQFLRMVGPRGTISP